MSAFFAFLHHLAAFSLVAALVIEFVVIRENLSVASARKLQVADAVFGFSAGVVLAVGLLRVFFFEKGQYYYFHNVAFIAKILLFVVIAVLSIYPTMQFIAWRKSTKRGEIPSVSAFTLRRIRTLIHAELALLIPLILCAALMARGLGNLD